MAEWTEKQLLGIQSCLSFFNIKEAGDFFSYLPKKLQEALEKNERDSLNKLNPHVFLSSYEEFFKNIDASWLKGPLEEFPLSLREEMISALPENIKNQLVVKKKAPSSPFFSSLLLKQLVEKIWDKQVFLQPMLPNHPLNILLKKTPVDIMEIIDYLGVIEFSYEIKTIVDGKVLEQLQKCFSDRQWKYIKQAIQSRSKKEKLEGLLKGIKSKKELQKKVLSEGLKNLAFSFSENEKNLIWHLVRKLPKEVGLQLEEAIKMPQKEASKIIWKKELENFLKRKER